MAIDPELLFVKPINEIPVVPIADIQTGNILAYTGTGDLKQISANALLGFIKSGNTGFAKEGNAPTPYDAITYPDGLIESYKVVEPISTSSDWYAAASAPEQAKFPITQPMLDANSIFFDVENGVVSVFKQPILKGIDGENKIEKYVPGNTYSSGQQVITDDGWFGVRDGMTATPTDIPSEDSFIWESLGKKLNKYIESKIDKFKNNEKRNSTILNSLAFKNDVGGKVYKTNKIAVEKGQYIEIEVSEGLPQNAFIYDSSNVLIKTIVGNNFEITEDGFIEVFNGFLLKFNPTIEIYKKNHVIIYDESKLVDHSSNYKKWGLNLLPNDIVTIFSDTDSPLFDVYSKLDLVYYDVPKSNAIRKFKVNANLYIEVYLLQSSIGLGDYYVKIERENNTKIYKEFKEITNFKKPTTLIRLDFNSNRVNSVDKDIFTDGVMTIDFNGEILQKKAKMEIQGSSSVVFPKKNWEFSFFNDDESKFEFSINNSVKLSAWRFKAYWIDATRMRDIVACRLWREIEMTRPNFPKRDIDYSYSNTGVNSYDTGALGVVDGYAGELYIDGEFYGLGTLNLTKKAGNYNLKTSNQNHIQIETGVRQMNFYTMTEANEDLEFRSPKNPDATVYAKLEAFKTACSTPGVGFKTAISNIVNATNLIDYVIFTQLLYLPDNYGNNIMLTTWGDKFHFMPYDLDNSFGLYFGGDSIYIPTKWAWEEKDDLPDNTKEFWNKVKDQFSVEIAERYTFLKSTGVISPNNIFKIAKEIEVLYGKKYDTEFTKWSDTPSKNITSVSQFCTFLQSSLTWLDAEIL